MNQSQIQTNHKSIKKDSGENNNKLSSGSIVATKFRLIDKVGQGSFGMIYKTENMETGEIFATKFEKREENSNGAVSLLVREIKVLIEVQDFEGFPQIVFYGRDEYYNYFMQTYLGYNLEQLLKRCNYKFSIQSVLKIGIILIERIKMLHSKNLIHRDLKPDNICIGYDDIDQIYLIDFGLAKYYRNSQGDHIPQSDRRGMIGTARYASLTAHLGKEQSRKDDIESLGYVLVYLAKGRLPWMNLNTSTKSEKYQKIKEFKQQITLEKLCEGLPKCFLNLFIYARGLDFQGEPEYSFLKDQFQKQYQIEVQSSQNHVPLDFEWERLPELKKRKQRVIANLLKQKLEKQTEIKPELDIKKSYDERPEQRGSSFLNVPVQENEQQQLSPEKNKQSRRCSQNVSSMGTSQINNYNQQSQKENFRKFAYEKREQSYFSIEKKEQNQKNFLKQTSTKAERQQALQDIDNDYRDFDDLDQLADEETNIAIFNITPHLSRRKFQ
ncbi:unnamed protein product [Paramecium pentaurelia]|uniref:Casein kinase I n=1 Tax=Paramecium pentaurelia TaxID=43138 RepID=A0A8S1YCS9_9CILI|nr:unnamed protein product [Paramecium pentaurelia]